MLQLSRMPRLPIFSYAFLVVVVYLASGVTMAAEDAASVSRADSLYGAGSWADAVKAYAQILKSAPENGRLWHRYGSALLQAGDAKAAVPALEKAEAIGHNPVTMYNLACALVATNQPDRAIDWLAKTAEAGFNQTAQLEADPDLVPLHTHPRWAAVREAVDRNARPCTYDERYRFMEFWIGDWDVKTPDGSPAGQSHVESILGTCVIFENWTGLGGMSGKSFNFIDPTGGKWKQTWVDDKGDVHEYTGEIVGGTMRFQREVRNIKGALAHHRMSLMPLTPDHVRQLGEQSLDGGSTWTVTYDLHYHRKKGEAP